MLVGSWKSGHCSSNLRNNNQGVPIGSFLAFYRDQIEPFVVSSWGLLMGISWHIIPSFAKSQFRNAIFMFSRCLREYGTLRVRQIKLADFSKPLMFEPVCRNLFGVISFEFFPSQVLDHLLFDDRKLEVSDVCV